MTYDPLSMANVQFLREGIPMPIVDSLVEGWYTYLGEGEFITESGRTFCWRDGRFENPDGKVMEIPASVRDHLHALGVDHQPTAQDMVEARARAEAERTTTETETPEGVLVAESWGGDYLHTGGVSGSTTGRTGNQADISVFDRSPGFSEYYGVSFISGSNYGLGFQVSDIENTNTVWHPNMHRVVNGFSTFWDYPSYAFSTTPSTSVTKNFKIALLADGTVRPYVDASCIDWNGAYWSPTPANTTCRSAFEIASDSNTVAPHDPANHHSNIKTRASDFSTWSFQTSSCTKFNVMYNNSTGQAYTGLYPVAHWVITNYYDWMARP